MARYNLEKTKKDNIYKYQNAAGETKYAYRYKYYDKLQNRQEKSKYGLPSELAAERALINVKADILDGNEDFVKSDNYKLMDWMEIWMAANEKVWRIGTYELYKRNIERHILPSIGKMKLNKITNMIMQRELINPLIEKGMSQRTIINISRIVTTALNSAVEERIIKDNPVTRLDFGKANGKRDIKYLSEQELKLFLKIAHDYDPTTYYTVFLTLGMSGMRKGELAGLRWSDIDFQNHTITIERTRINNKVGPPKSDNGYRTIHVNRILIDQLKKYKTWCIQCKWEKNMHLVKDDYVFIDRHHFTPIGVGYVNDALVALLDNCPKGFPTITPHGFRHTYTSILIANKVPLVSVAKIIGDHPATVMNVYAHSLAQTEEETVELFNHFNVVDN
ncbi:site-specific integrase [Solibacillus sp. MA9]|uniref:Site-specific integrase n=1 Tax=Solibacillus palustris TaxID=2908203 RepID=A0ABS9UBM8_9BACL|nr:site-specific integrase [Solibacillus sp. MA9]MCH7321742.1 site-specific integrase [Solibacillus sp. MA9]